MLILETENPGDVKHTTEWDLPGGSACSDICPYGEQRPPTFKLQRQHFRGRRSQGPVKWFVHL